MRTLRLRSRQWIVDENGGIIMGEGRQEIFENIERTGSINQTAKVMKMSYKGVWSKIKATEEALKTKLVHADKRRGTRLTQEGKRLLEQYIELKRKCLKADDRIFDEIFRGKSHDRSLYEREGT